MAELSESAVLGAQFKLVPYFPEYNRNMARSAEIRRVAVSNKQFAPFVDLPAGVPVRHVTSTESGAVPGRGSDQAVAPSDGAVQLCREAANSPRRAPRMSVDAKQVTKAEAALDAETPTRSELSGILASSVKWVCP